MSSRLLSCLFAASALLSVGCDDSTGLSDSEAANVRVVHASTAAGVPTGPIDVSVDGEVDPDNADIEFAAASECIRVDADSPDLVVQLPTGTGISGPTSFPAGGRSTLIVSGPVGNLRVTAVEDPFVPLQSGNARVRIFNGRTSGVAMDVTATPFNNPGAAQSDVGVAQAEASTWLEVPAGAAALSLRNTGTQTEVAQLNVALVAGQEMTLIAVDPATTGGPLRWVVTSPCTPADD
jgi:Domain of unknown function (DUF4397)